MIPRSARFRRFVYYLVIVTAIVSIVIRAYSYYYEYYENSYHKKESVLPYNKYIDQIGKFLPYSGYKILQTINQPVADPLIQIYNYFDEQLELKLYFKLVPITSHHVTLTNLKDQVPYKEKYLKILMKEQELLDGNDTYIECTGTQFLISDKNEIRMIVEFPDDYINNTIKTYQKRWNKKFSNLISEHYTSFYITIAYQYQHIPDKETSIRLEQSVQGWQPFPLAIELDPIEICSHKDIVSYMAIIPDGI